MREASANAASQDHENTPESGGTAVVDAPTKAPRPVPTRTPPRQLPQWQVLLHNDDVNEVHFVAETVFSLTPLSKVEAAKRTLEAHQRGLSLLLVTHRERAELYVEQFRSKHLTVTIEPAR